MPEIPKSRRPQVDQEQEWQNLIQRKRDQRKNREDALRPKIDWEKKRDQDLQQEAIKPRPMKFFMEASLVQPYAVVSGKRKNFSSDLTVHFNLMLRQKAEEELHNSQHYYGIRAAHFAGSGIYKDIPGRYAYLYFGPAYGYGKFTRAEQAIGAKEAGPRQSDVRDTDDFPTRKGWMVTTGIAVQQRIARTDRTGEQPDDDLNTRAIAFDAPGIWGELRLMTIHFGAIHVSYNMGVQTGEEKLFAWFGMGAAGWY